MALGCWVQANHPVPRRRLLYYFEVTVREATGGSITLGFSDRAFKQGRHPGCAAGVQGGGEGWGRGAGQRRAYKAGRPVCLGSSGSGAAHAEPGHCLQIWGSGAASPGITAPLTAPPCSYEPNSYGYRGDTGRKHHCSLPARGEEYGPAFGCAFVVLVAWVGGEE